MKFYEMLDSLDQIADRWYLGEPVDEDGETVDARLFTAGSTVDVRSALTIPPMHPGLPLDFTFAAFEMPVVRRHVGELIQSIAPDAIQRIPVRVQAGGAFEILNVVKTIVCIDEEKTGIMRWTKSDGRPDKVGQYRMVWDIGIRPEAVEGEHLLRIGGWNVAMICSDVLKRVLDEDGVTGVEFRPV